MRDTVEMNGRSGRVLLMALSGTATVAVSVVWIFWGIFRGPVVTDDSAPSPPANSQHAPTRKSSLVATELVRPNERAASPEKAAPGNTRQGNDDITQVSATKVVGVGDSEPAESSVVVATATSESAAHPADGMVPLTIELLVGHWTGSYQGSRTLTMQADGSATMIARPDGIGATLLARELTFQIRWKLKGEELEFETVGGEPASKVQIVTRLYGKKRVHRVISWSADEIVLLDEDGKTQYVWKRAQETLTDDE